MRHFARARATAGPTRIGWLFMASIVTGAALWASTFISILALEPSLKSGFEPVSVITVLVIAIAACVAGFEIGSRATPELAPELGGVLVGVGVLAMHTVGLHGWHIEGTFDWNAYGLAAASALGLGLSTLSVNRANRPVTRYCRHGAAIVLAFTICSMHYALSASATLVADAARELPPHLIPAKMLCAALMVAVFLMMGSGFSTYVIDLRTRTESADRIHQLSFNDTMTGLPNRIAFNERLSFDLAEAHERAETIAVFSIDLDGFKDINDMFSHSAGDLVLIEIAQRLRSTAGHGEFIARQNGDEFLALQMSPYQPHEAEAFAGRLSAALAAPFRIGDEQVHLTASIGYSVFPTDTRDRDHLVSNAKLAMHRGKGRQPGTICRYDQQMDDESRARRALARDLLNVDFNGELELHYQLQTSLSDGRIIGAEALLRWRHPKHGMISPADFIPLAEGNEAIVEIGKWVLRTACADAAADRVPGVVAVNVSPVQFARGDLVETVETILHETGLDACRLEIEVTESMLMTDKDRTVDILKKLKAMGISVAMDDFGTGYSSLGTLHAFPFDKIKLDQSFVQQIPDDALAASIVKTVLALACSMGVPVLAEGIETERQREFLINEGCAEGQGYLLAKPVPAIDLAASMALLLQRRLAGQIQAVATTTPARMYRS